jgi:hypothetical protein
MNLYISDLVIVLIIFCLYSINVNSNILYKDRFLNKFYKTFFIFAIYFFIFYGGIIPYINNDFNYLVFLQKNRSFLYYIILLTSVYFFTLRGLKYFYLTTLFLGIVILTAFLISLLTGLKIIPIDVFERYSGSEMMRITIFSWGFIQILFPLSFILFLFSRKIKFNIKYRKLVYLAGILMVVTLLITLTRRNYISIFGSVLIIVLLNSFIFRKSKILTFAKVIIPVSIILLVISLALPKYVNYIANISEDIYLLFTKGSDTQGEVDYRVSGTGDLLITKKYITENFIFGTGYSYLYWGESDVATSSRGNTYALAADAAREVPVYNIFFSYGLAGFVIIVFLYSFLVKLFVRLNSLLKKQFNALTAYPYELLFAIFILYMIVDKFTFSLYTLGDDFPTPYYGVYLGMAFALYRKLKIITVNNEVNLKPPTPLM